MTFSDISIRNPVLAWMLMAAMIIFGAVSLTRLGVSQLPDVQFPVITISLTDIGASPTTMETTIVDPIEGAVLQVPGLVDEVSQSIDGSATITLTFGLNEPINEAMVDTEDEENSVSNQLPKDMYPPVYTKTDPDQQPIMYIGLLATSPTVSLRDMMLYIDDTADIDLASVTGVGQIDEFGYLQPELRVWPEEAQLRKYQLTVEDVINTIQSEHVLLPSGLLETPQQDAEVETMSQAQSLKQFEGIYISARGGAANYRPIPLSTVAKCTLGTDDQLRISRFDGQTSVGLGIVMQTGANAVTVANAVYKKLAQMNKAMPKGMKLHVLMDSTKYIKQSVTDLETNLVLSALATALVCWIFLGSWSATFNIVLAIPTSIIGTFTVLYFAGFTLNTFTLLGLSLAIGIVVDDAIMVLENIVRHQEMGKSAIVASLDGARQITFAAVATSLAIVAIFLPVAFMNGIIGKYFYQFALTMVTAVMLSLLEAITLTPMRCAQFVSVAKRTSFFGKAVERFFVWAAAMYKKGLIWALDHRALVLSIGACLFASSMLITRDLGQVFMPSQDENVIYMSFKTPVGSSLQFTASRMRMVENICKQNNEIQGYYTSVGGHAGGEENSAFAFMTLYPKNHRPIDPALHRQPSAEELGYMLSKQFDKIPGLSAFVLDLSTRGFTTTRGTPIEAQIKGPDLKVLAATGSKMMQAMKASGYMTSVDTDYEGGMPEVEVIPDRYEAAKHGVSVGTIAQTINALVGGEDVGFFPRGGHQDYIELRLTGTAMDRQDQINGLLVRNNRGEVVPLKDVVTLKDAVGVEQVSRDKRQNAYTLYANVAPGKSQATALDVMDKLAKEYVPPGYTLTMGQGSSVFVQSFDDMMMALAFGICIAYMILASQFNSFIDPVTVLMALPLSATGALALLWAWPYLTFDPQNVLTLNIYSLIGMLLLMGLVKKNSIMLVDFTNEVRQKKKKNVHDALVEACPVRFRPILMTTVAIIVAALPEAFDHGPGSETQVPMAVPLIGGVSVAAVFTLFLVPCFYSVVARFEGKHTHENVVDEALAEAAKHPITDPDAAI